MLDQTKAIKGRGASWNPANRFEPRVYEVDEDLDPSEEPAPGTTFLSDASKSLITYNDSPDVGFEASINPYRGCEHGCIYCYARPFHEYLGMSAGTDFESKIMVKEQAPAILRNELAARKWKPQTLAISGVTDCYQPAERKFKLTRQCLEVLAEFRNPTAIITKNKLVARDLDVFEALNRYDCIAVNISVTTLDTQLNRILEPRSSLPKQRLDAIRTLAEAGIPVGVFVAPIIPGLTDHEVPEILHQCAKAGARCAGYIVLRLPHAVAPLFERWLDQHYPDRKDKVMNRIKTMRGGAAYDSTFGKRMKGEGIFAQQIATLFKVSAQHAGLSQQRPELSTAHFRRPGSEQLALFESA
jgi:DNA repair photolyase